MTRLIWNDPKQKKYQYGVDRGVLYIPDSSGNYSIGRPWNGLKEVSVEADKGESKSYYIDGIKYAEVKRPGDFRGKLTAFTYPGEFLPYDGFSEISEGILATNQQNNRYFGLSYRTMVGNDAEGRGYGYKIHLIYNLQAEIEPSTYSSLASEMEPMDFSWSLSAVPVRYSGIRPTAHFIIDTTRVERSLVELLEGTLYGTDILQPTLPQLSEIRNLMTNRVKDVIVEPI